MVGVGQERNWDELGKATGSWSVSKLGGGIRKIEEDWKMKLGLYLTECLLKRMKRK